MNVHDGGSLFWIVLRLINVALSMLVLTLMVISSKWWRDNLSPDLRLVTAGLPALIVTTLYGSVEGLTLQLDGGLRIPITTVILAALTVGLIRIVRDDAGPHN